MRKRDKCVWACTSNNNVGTTGFFPLVYGEGRGENKKVSAEYKESLIIRCPLSAEAEAAASYEESWRQNEGGDDGGKKQDELAAARVQKNRTGRNPIKARSLVT